MRLTEFNLQEGEKENNMRKLTGGRWNLKSKTLFRPSVVKAGRRLALSTGIHLTAGYVCVLNIAIIRRQLAKTKAPPALVARPAHGMLVGRWLRRSHREGSRQERKIASRVFGLHCVIVCIARRYGSAAYRGRLRRGTRLRNLGNTI